MGKFLSRKFILAFLFAGTSCAGLAFKLLTGSDFVTLVGIILGAFTAGDAAINYIHRDKANPDSPNGE